MKGSPSTGSPPKSAACPIIPTAVAKPKPKTQPAATTRKKHKREPFPWFPFLLIVACVFGFWVAPALWDKAPLQVTFEDKK